MMTNDVGSNPIFDTVKVVKGGLGCRSHAPIDTPLKDTVEGVDRGF